MLIPNSLVDLTVWSARRAAFLAFAICLLFLVATAKFYGSTFKHDWVMKHGAAQAGMIEVRRWESGCRATLNYQLEPSNAPRVDIFASAALCDALAGKGEIQIPIHFIGHGPLKGAVVLDFEFRDPPSLIGYIPRRGWPRLAFWWFLMPLAIITGLGAIKWGYKRSHTIRRIVDLLKTPL
jgi:hypothetical protein